MKKSCLLMIFAFFITSCQFGTSSRNISNYQSELTNPNASSNTLSTNKNSEVISNTMMSSSYSTNSISTDKSTISSSTTISSNNSLTSTSQSTLIQNEELVLVHLSANTSVENNNGGVVIDNQIITITKAGTYKIDGTLTDGSLVVNASKEEKVTLILNGVNITSSINSPLYCLGADKLIIELADDSVNTLNDAVSYTYINTTDEEPNACLFSKDDLTIKGNGVLNVTSNFNNGIGSKDDLKISNGNITIKAPNNAIKGNDSIEIKGGNINATSTNGDGLKSDNVEDTTKGYIEISGGVLNVNAKYDGLQSDNYINISNGSLTIKTNNGAIGSISSNDTNSYKGIKATNDITISGGNININSYDDSIHSNKNVYINGGNFVLSSSDDGVHADEILHITDGTIEVLKSYEGLEATQITIDDGEISLFASDDGINVAGGDGSNNDWRPGGSGGPGGWWRYNENLATTTLDYTLTINGGYVYVYASGDGLDSNGDIFINGGTIIVNGPTDNGNGAIDYGDSGATFKVNGGILIAVGSSGMAVAPTTSSSQYSAKITFSSSQSSLIAILDENNNPVIAFVSAKRYNSMVVSHPDFTNGTTYTISVNGNYTNGDSKGGLYTGGTYSGGTAKKTFSFSSKTQNISV